MHTFQLVDRDGRDLGTVSLARLDNPPGVTIPRGRNEPSLRVVANEPAAGDGLPVLVVEEVSRGDAASTLRTKNDDTVGFYRNAGDAETVLFLVTRVRKQRGQSTPTSQFHTRRNVYVAWRRTPTGAQLEAVERCLR